MKVQLNLPFFNEIEKRENLNIGIFSPFLPIVSRNQEFSHRFSQSLFLKLDLEYLGHTVTLLNGRSDYSPFDILICEWGMEFKQSFDIPGGIDSSNGQNLIINLEQIYNFQKTNKLIYSYGLKPNSFKEVFKHKLSDSDTSKHFKTLVNVEKYQYEFDKFIPFSFVKNKECLILGDSHSQSVWNINSNVIRLDGKTLRGILKSGFEKEIENLITFIENKSIKECNFYFGNIDIRHHLMREENPELITQKLFTFYVQKIKEFSLKYEIKCNIVNLLPIETEERRIPKTGYFKGSPFYGTRKERTKLMYIANEVINSYDNSIKWNSNWYLNDYDFTQNMEKPGSVHLAPKFYKENLFSN